MSSSIILIGPMGAGKTSIGRHLAGLLRLPFRDTDHIVRERAGVDIDFIFEKEGEAGFRRREQAVFADLVADDSAVIATGGGIVLDPANRARMENAAAVVFLETSVKWQLERTRRSRHRPLLDTADPEKRLEEIHALRDPLYRECATMTVKTDNRRVSIVADAIMNELLRTGAVDSLA